jgi:hypothetical protein
LPYNGKVGGDLESGFLAPIRDKASRKLKAWGTNADIDQNKLCYDGFIMLAELYKNADRRLKGEIIESIKMFSPDTLPAKTLVEFDRNRTSKENAETINRFRNNLVPAN